MAESDSESKAEYGPLIDSVEDGDSDDQNEINPSFRIKSTNFFNSNSCIYLAILFMVLLLIYLESCILTISYKSYDPTTETVKVSSETLERLLKSKNLPGHPLPLMETLKLIELHSNLPALYWHGWATNSSLWTPRTPVNATLCDQIEMIPIHYLKQINRLWQTLQSPSNLANGSNFDTFMIYIYNAYYDDRLIQGGPLVRLLTSCDQQHLIEYLSLGCLLWFDETLSPVLSNVTEILTIWPKEWGFGTESGTYGPQLITCSIPESFRDQIPRAVSLTTKPGCEVEVENIVRVINNVNKSDLIHQQDNRIGVCVKAFRFGTYDFSVRLVEWLEMVRLMGGAKVYFYVYDATESVYQVLNHYATEGFVEWRELTFPGWQPNVDGMYQFYYDRMGGRFWQQELLEINDCLYRNYQRHPYIAMFDVDEMLMPQEKLDDWYQVIESVESQMSLDDFQYRSYYLHRHAHIYEEYEEDNDTIPNYLYMMRHTYRAEPYQDGSNIKCFHRSEMVTILHNHYPLRCASQPNYQLGNSCYGMDLNPVNQSMLMHYRMNRGPDKDCILNKSIAEIKQQCMIHDQTAWKWYDRLEPLVRHKLRLILSNSNSNSNN